MIKMTKLDTGKHKDFRENGYILRGDATAKVMSGSVIFIKRSILLKIKVNIFHIRESIESELHLTGVI